MVGQVADGCPVQQLAEAPSHPIVGCGGAFRVLPAPTGTAGGHEPASPSVSAAVSRRVTDDSSSGTAPPRGASRSPLTGGGNDGRCGRGATERTAAIARGPRRRGGNDRVGGARRPVSRHRRGASPWSKPATVDGRQLVLTYVDSQCRDHEHVEVERPPREWRSRSGPARGHSPATTPTRSTRCRWSSRRRWAPAPSSIGHVQAVTRAVTQRAQGRDPVAIYTPRGYAEWHDRSAHPP